MALNKFPEAMNRFTEIRTEIKMNILFKIGLKRKDILMWIIWHYTANMMEYLQQLALGLLCFSLIYIVNGFPKRIPLGMYHHFYTLSFGSVYRN